MTNEDERKRITRGSRDRHRHVVEQHFSGLETTLPNGSIMSARYLRVAPYAQDEMNLPVENVETAIPFYETVMGFQVLARTDAPAGAAALGRDEIQIGLAENGGDPSQEGCFFEVDDIQAAFAELKANGLDRDNADYRIDQHGDTSYRVFFVVAPDGLCYCLGERQ